MREADKSYGAFIGLAVGDAMGAPVEFLSPGSFDPVTEYRSGGPFNLPAGYWTDDTSMALCLAESLILLKGEINQEDQLRRYSDWYQHGHNSSTGECFDIGNGTRLSLERFLNGSHNLGPSSSEGNGSLMRLSPVPIVYHRHSESDVREACLNSSLTTHNLFASELCSEFGVLLHRAINGCKKDELQIANLTEWCPDMGNSGHAPKSLAAALHFFHSTSCFEDAILKAVNYGDDADTVGAITGQLAGAFYGLSKIPFEWREKLCKSWFLHSIAVELYILGLDV